MLQVFHQSSDSTQGKTIATGLVPTVLQFRPGLPAQLSFSGGISTEATCVYCVDAPCVNYQIEEVRAAALPDFPADRNTAVCATSALTRPGEVGAPTVDPEACVSCGVCASRCPVGAIFLSPTAVVNDVASEIFVEADLNADAYRLLRNMFAGARREGVLLEETAVVVDQMQVRLERVCRNVDDRFPNHLARNMLPTSTSTQILPLISNPAPSNHRPESRIQGAGGKSGKNLTWSGAKVFIGRGRLCAEMVKMRWVTAATAL
ncbi:4Fe-4S binding protein [Paraburkholderia agricolaris]